MGKYHAYPEYKDSGVDFLGELPIGWSVLRGKYVFSEFAERSTTGEELLLSVSEYYGVKPRGEVIDEGDYLSRADSLIDYKKCAVNDLVMNIMLAWKCGLGVTKYEGIVSPAYSVFRFGPKAHPDYMHYLLRTSTYTGHFKTRSTGVIDSRLRLYPESFGDVSIVLPTREEQITIANFLDHETAKIDTLIEQQQQLIQLLKEKRQAVISHAVTKGLNPDAQMKDSGVEWLGEVPANWVVSNLDFALIGIGDVDHYMPKSVDTGIPYVMTGDLKEFASNINFEGCKQISLSDYTALSKKIKCTKGDVIMARYATIGTVSYVDIDMNFVVSYSCVTIKPNLSKVIGLYLYYYFKSDAFLQGIQSQINTNTQGNVGISDLKKIKIAIPPLPEQEVIIQYLQSKIDHFDYLSDKCETSIQLAQERRTALISAAVTGKIDVRNWQAPQQ